MNKRWESFWRRARLPRTIHSPLENHFSFRFVDDEDTDLPQHTTRKGRGGGGIPGGEGWLHAPEIVGTAVGSKP